MISVPKEFSEAEPFPPGGPDLGGGDAAVAERAQAEQARASWDAVVALTAVRSTASFFAAARCDEAPTDEVLVLSAPSQPIPRAGERLKLELRRARHGQLSQRASAQDQATSDALLAARRAAEKDATFLLAVDASKIAPGVTRTVPFVSQKGATKTAQQLQALLKKPGRETLLEQYSDDVAEFSVLVGVSSGAEEEGLAPVHVPHLDVSE